MGWLNCIGCIYCVTTETGMIIGCERDGCDEWRDDEWRDEDGGESRSN